MRGSWPAAASALPALLVFLLVAPAFLGIAVAAAPPSTERTAVWATDQPAGARSSDGTPLGGDPVLSLTLALTPSHAAALASLLAGIADPRSPHYRHYLSHAQFVSEFSPPPEAVAKLTGFFGARGASGFASTADRLGLTFQIRASDAASALGVEFVEPGASSTEVGSSYYQAVGSPSIPADLYGLVSGIGGLSNGGTHYRSSTLAQPGPTGLVRPGLGSFILDGTSGVGEPWYFGSDYASAYRASSLFPPSTAVTNATFPTAQAVATLLISGYDRPNNTDLPPFDPAVVDAYYNDTFPAGWPHPVVAGVPVTVAGETPPTPGFFAGVSDATSNSIENSLDLEMAGSMAPGATLVNFYFGARLLEDPAFSGTEGDTADYFAQCLASALAYDYTPAQLTAVSGSFGIADLSDALWNTELAVAQAMGVTVVAASGDQGNAPDLFSGRSQGSGPTWPATAGFNTTGAIAVGGTSPTLAGNATGTYDGGELNASFDPTVTGIAAQTAWYDVLGGFGNISGTEGGASTVASEPPWQLRSAAQPAIVNATVAQGVDALGRTVPDVAFPANQTVAYVSADATGTFFEVLEGTSIGAPLLAGLVASWSAVAGHRFGYLAPELYRIASYYAANPTDPTNPFLDVTTGGNFVFQAAPGWDGATGWGGLDALRFLAADANPAVRDYVYVGPTPGLPPPFAIGGGSPTYWLLFIIGLSVAVSVVLVITLLRPRPPAGAPPPAAGGLPPPAPSGTAWAPSAPGPGPLPPPAPPTFPCPYCGAARAAEPVRCPTCGRL